MVLAYRTSHFTSGNVHRLHVKLQKYTHMTSNIHSIGKKNKIWKKVIFYMLWIHWGIRVSGWWYKHAGSVTDCWQVVLKRGYRGLQSPQSSNKWDMLSCCWHLDCLACTSNTTPANSNSKRLYKATETWKSLLSAWINREGYGPEMRCRSTFVFTCFHWTLWKHVRLLWPLQAEQIQWVHLQKHRRYWLTPLDTRRHNPSYTMNERLQC